VLSARTEPLGEPEQTVADDQEQERVALLNFDSQHSGLLAAVGDDPHEQAGRRGAVLIAAGSSG
jgi:hypothetical protein